MLNILLVLKDPHREILDLLDGHRVENSDGDDLLKRVSSNSFDLVITDSPAEIVLYIHEADPRVEVFLLGCSDELEALMAGAAACFEYPFDKARFKSSIENIDSVVSVRRETEELERELRKKYTFAGVVGKNPRMLEIFSFIRRIAPYFKVVTIMGETGSGKEEVAKALHRVSPAADKPFIACNCGGLVDNLIESEFFGHVKGAFTGAISDKVGVFEAAGEGVVFLDEIGDLPMSFQPHLLRVLQNGEFRRVGSSRTIKARCRVIAATNRDLQKDVKDGRFREDLFYRLTPLTITVPPLRERLDDIPQLCKFILDRFSEKTGKRIFGLSRCAQMALASYSWPGNVRELENVIEHAAILTNEPFIKDDILPASIKEEAKTSSIASLEDTIRKHIQTALEYYNGNQTRAAKALGISRRALIRKMEKYSLK